MESEPMRETLARPRARHLAAAAALLLVGGGLQAANDPWDVADAKWRQGPVKYLLSKEEDQAYKKLKTEQERSSFVEEFWAKRDPTPGTPENEFRIEFYRRAREAAARFTENDGKGWQDDRGRVFILLGAPDDSSENTSLLDSGGGSGGASAGGGFGAPGGGESAPASPTRTLRFIYMTDPLSGKRERLELNFRSEPTGGFRLEEKIDWNHPALRGLAHRPPPAPTAAATPAPAATPPPPAAATPAPVEPPAPPEPEATPQSELMQQVRAAADSGASIPLDVTVNYYKAADGSTFATLTLEVKRAALAATADPTGLVIAAELLDASTGNSEQRFFKQEHFGSFEGNLAAGIKDTLLYQAERPLKPGSYKAVFALKDPSTGQLGRLEKDLVVPTFGEEQLTLSTVTLARKVERLAAPPPAGEMTPFVLGNFKVVPRPDNVYRQGEELLFYYQIYGAKTDDVTKYPKVDLSYTFEKSMSGQWKMVGRQAVVTPNQNALVQAFGLPLTNWPGGEYRIVIKVTDTLAATSTTAEVPFSIEAPGGEGAKSKAKAKSKG
jgi:GWxTD domain-containing protein